jgi:hypothetical protein
MPSSYSPKDDDDQAHIQLNLVLALKQLMDMKTSTPSFRMILSVQLGARTSCEQAALRSSRAFYPDSARSAQFVPLLWRRRQPAK